MRPRLTPVEPASVFTVGPSKRSTEAFVALLKAAESISLSISAARRDLAPILGSTSTRGPKRSPSRRSAIRVSPNWVVDKGNRGA